MAIWPVSPEWVDPRTGINSGNQYNSGDGITVTDFNNLIKDLIYIKNVPAPAIQTKSITITTNGTQTVTPDSSHDALSSVLITTNVPGANLEGKSVTITGNGKTYVTPSSGYDGLSDVEINVKVPLQDKTVNIGAPGVYTVTPDAGYTGFTSITIVVTGSESTRGQLVTNDDENFVDSNGYNFKVVI